MGCVRKKRNASSLPSIFPTRKLKFLRLKWWHPTRVKEHKGSVRRQDENSLFARNLPIPAKQLYVTTGDDEGKRIPQSEKNLIPAQRVTSTTPLCIQGFG